MPLGINISARLVYALLHTKRKTAVSSVTLSPFAPNHFMENEYEGRHILSHFINVSYRWKNLTVALFGQNLFVNHRKMEEVENHNRLVHKLYVARNRDTSSTIGIKLTWTLSKGRQFKGIDRDTNSLKEMETGVAKSGK